MIIKFKNRRCWEIYPKCGNHQTNYQSSVVIRVIIDKFRCEVVIERTFSSAELFGRTSTVRYGPNDRTFFCRTQNFFRITFYANGILLYFFFLNEPHVHGVIIGLQVKRPKECQQSQSWNKTIVIT